MKESDEDKLYRIRNTNNIVGHNERIKADMKRIASKRKEAAHLQRV